MKSNRYTASIIYNGNCLQCSNGDNLNQLTVFLINYIETMAPNSMGEIFDHEKGTIIQRCKRSYID